MRPACHGDVVAAARALRALPGPEREGGLLRLMRAADWADRFRLYHRRKHPYWGDGSLMAAALAEDPPPEPRLADAEYCQCLSMVLQALAARGCELRS